MSTDVVVVVPCYNEERRLPAARFEEFLRKTPDVGFVFVDDGSRDGTLALLRRLEAAAPDRVSLLELPHNRGKAEAVRRGVLRAFEHEPGIVGYWDADLATPLSAIPELRGVLEERPDLEMVLGARVVLLGRRIERLALRHYLGRVAATAIALVLRLQVYDTQCGAKLFRATPSVRRLFEEPFAAGWLFDVELLARRIRAAPGGAEEVKTLVCEMPLREWTDVAGSKLGAEDYLRALTDLLRIWRRYLRGPASSS